MSSSTTGTTHLERALTAHFRKVYIHLHLSARFTELDFLLSKFTALLDLSDVRLQLALYPASLPPQERAKVQTDIEAMDNIRRVSKGMKGSERIYEAGSACADMGWCLIGAGRKREGEVWCGFDGELGDIAWRVEQDERVWAAQVAAEEERRKRDREGVVGFARAYEREVVEID